MATNASSLASSVIVSVVVSCLVTLQTAQGEPAPTRLCTAFISQVDRRAFDVRALEAEVNRIWIPYGIHVDGLSGPCTEPASGPTIKVRLRRILGGPQPANIPPNVLGSIYFVGGVPQPVIDLWADEAVRILGGSATSFYQGFADGRARVELARLLGRSLAHELGHYLLATESHTESGLMRRTYGPWDARTADARVFALDATQVDALQRTRASWRGAPASPDDIARGTRDAPAVAAFTGRVRR